MVWIKAHTAAVINRRHFIDKSIGWIMVKAISHIHQNRTETEPKN